MDNIKTFKEYWKSLSPDEKGKLADSLDSSVVTLAQVASGFRRVSPERAKILEGITGIDRCVFLYPDEYKTA